MMLSGTLFALRLLGPTLGFLLSSLCLNFYEDPFYDPGYGTKDPRWIGAWWLGFIILETRRNKITNRATEGHVESHETFEQEPNFDLPLFRRSSKVNGIVGYYVLLPKYMEMQFKQSASKASLYSGPAGLVGMQLGILFGGIAIRKFKPRPRVMTGGIVIAESFSFIALILCMLITCPVPEMTGTSSITQPDFNLQNDCNTDCLCTTKVYTPVCGPDGKSTYFSPCHAGCTGYNKTGKKEYFTDCKCVHNTTGHIITGDASKSYCGFECQWLITFVVVLSLGKLVSSTARVANALVTLRCVDPEDKSLALGALSGVFSLLGKELFITHNKS
ncbi:Solute carrier organic anion transporter like protein [Argiope bruennichi]|uniref:Solute carrier organic anion transporter like protein n=1 Tax=Argiope bruennichi TaxID=94029 RepID=A0A8T0FZJ9_ARGBR|nr:Solute carrier organic anion transporter like protein [Argiope bruennichi]